MKNHLIILCILMTFGAVQTKAQLTRPNVIKANVLGTVVGGFSVSLEKAIDHNKSAALTGRFVFFDFREIVSEGLAAAGIDEGQSNWRLIDIDNLNYKDMLDLKEGKEEGFRQEAKFFSRLETS